MWLKRTILMLSGAVLTLTLAAPAYSLTSFKSNILNTVWFCTQADPNQGELTIEPSGTPGIVTVHQEFQNVTCVLVDETTFTPIGSGTFHFVLDNNNVAETDISSGECTKQYDGYCNASLWVGYAEQTAGDSFLECGNEPCVFSTSDPTADAKNDKQVADSCSTAFPATTDYLGNNWFDKQTTFYQTKSDGTTCGNDLRARYCFTVTSSDGTTLQCLEKNKGKYFAHVSSAASTDYVVVGIEGKDPFNPDSGSFQLDFLQSGIQIDGFDPCDRDSAPQIGGQVKIKPGGCTLTDADHDGAVDNPRFFYDSQEVYKWMVDHGGVTNGTGTFFVTGKLTSGIPFIGFYTTHFNNTP